MFLLPTLVIGLGFSSIAITTQDVLAGDSKAISRVVSAINTLQQWYSNDSGLWNTTGWWNSANALTMLADFNTLSPALNQTIHHVFNNTFIQAQKSNPAVFKIMTPHSMTTYTGDFFPLAYATTRPGLVAKGFTNGYYDDEGWWALAWLKAYDNTHQQLYLQAAIDLFEDMTTGYNATCGGLWWDKNHSSNGAIENELFLAVAAQLANRASPKQYYLDWALKQWNWFHRSGLINDDFNINNGLDLETCQNDNGTIWSYNQGVILGGLLELYRAAPNPSYITIAEHIAVAAIDRLSDSEGILHEPCEPGCGADGPQFKGIFTRNLQLLQQAFPRNTGTLFKSFIDKNANSIWANDQDCGRLGLVWSGPYINATASTQSSACDTLVAAAALASS